VSKALGKVSSIKNIEFKESHETGACELIAEAMPDTDIRRDVFKALASANIPILMMRSQDMSLEEIFLNLTTTEEAK
jgi:ABC-2 type transport system ATP-binding protein